MWHHAFICSLLLTLTAAVHVHKNQFDEPLKSASPSSVNAKSIKDSLHPKGFRVLPSRFGETYRLSLEQAKEDPAKMHMFDNQENGMSSQYEFIHQLAQLATEAHSLLEGDEPATGIDVAPQGPLNGEAALDIYDEATPKNVTRKDIIKKQLNIAARDAERQHDQEFLSLLFEDFYSADELRHGLSEDRIKEFISLAKEHSEGLTTRQIKKHVAHLLKLVRDLNSFLKRPVKTDKQALKLAGIRNAISVSLLSFVSEKDDYDERAQVTQSTIKALAYLISVLKHDRALLLDKLHQIDRAHADDSDATDTEKSRLIKTFFADLSLALAAEPNAERLLVLEKAVLKRKLDEAQKNDDGDGAEGPPTINIGGGTVDAPAIESLTPEGRMKYCDSLKKEATEHPDLSKEMHDVIECFCDLSTSFMHCSAQLHLAVADLLSSLPSSDAINSMIEDSEELVKIRDSLLEAHAEFERKQAAKQNRKERTAATEAGPCSFGWGWEAFSGTCNTQLGSTCSVNLGVTVCANFGCTFTLQFPLLAITGGTCVEANASPTMYFYIDVSVCVPLKDVQKTMGKFGVTPCFSVANVAFYPILGYFVFTIQIPFIVSFRFQTTVQAYRPKLSLCDGSAEYEKLYCVMKPGDVFHKASVGINLIFWTWWFTVWQRGHFPTLCKSPTRMTAYGEMMDPMRTIIAPGGASELGNVNIIPDTESFPADFFNDYDQTFTFNCPANRAMYGIFGQHDNNREDRRFKFICAAIEGMELVNCITTAEVNNYDGLLSADCPAGYAMTGLVSRNDNEYEDRKFQYRCCQIRDKDFVFHTLFDCGANEVFINDFDDCFAAKVRPGTVLVGLYSDHRNAYEDRVWKLHYCSVDPSNQQGVVPRFLPMTVLTDTFNYAYRTTWNTAGILGVTLSLFSGVISTHDNSVEDRKFTWLRAMPVDPKYVVDGATACSTYTNQPDEIFDFTCPSWSVVVAIKARYDTEHQDRVYTFICCRLKGIAVGQITAQGKANSYDGAMNVNYYPQAIVGLSSEHDDSREDRIFMWKTARLGETDTQLLDTPPAPCNSFTNMDAYQGSLVDAGGDQRMIDSDLQCCGLCSSHTQCLHWVRIAADNRCLMYKNSPKRISGTASGKTWGFVTTKCAVKDNFRAAAGSVMVDTNSEIFSTSILACCNACSANFQCTHWTQSKTLSKCFLYKSTATGGSADTTFVYGTRATTVTYTIQ